MADETTQFILGDAAADAAGERRKRRFFGGRRGIAESDLTHCENCGASLAGEYCAKCGQHAIDYRRSIWRVAIDAADSFLNWDTKFLKSVGVLLIRPGKLTNDFNAGRRVRYVHPLRLYLLASIAFFLMAKLLNFTPSGPVDLSPEDRADFHAAMGGLTPEDRAEFDAVLGKLTAPDSLLTPAQRAKVDAVRERFLRPDESLTPQERALTEKIVAKLPRYAEKKQFKPQDVAKLDALLDGAVAAPAPAAPNQSATPADGQPAGAADGVPTPPAVPSPPAHTNGNPIIQFDNDGETKSPFGKWLQTRVKKKFGEDGTNAQVFLETLRSNVPTMMLCCVPLFAFVLKVLYIRQRRFYVEHLVYALHIHTFAYVAVVLITLIGMAAQRWSPSAQSVIVTALSFVVVAQVFLSIRRVYQQGWLMTIFKFILGGVVYQTVLIMALGATAFITLLMP